MGIIKSDLVYSTSYSRVSGTIFKKSKDLFIIVAFFIYLYYSFNIVNYFSNWILFQALGISQTFLPFIMPINGLVSLLPILLIELIVNYRRKRMLALKLFPFQSVFFLYLLIVVNFYILMTFTALYKASGIKFPHYYLHFLYYRYSVFWGALLYSFIGDLITYFTHRALHKYAFLWRFHKVHHAIIDVSIYNSYQHIVERLFVASVNAIVLAPIVIINPTMPAFIIWYLTIHAAFIHSELKFLNYGIFTNIIGNPMIHRAHHNSDEKYRDKNFAFMFPFIDMIFGTFVKPDPNDFYGPFGVKNNPAPNKLKDIFL